MPSFVEIGLSVPEKIFEGFIAIYGHGGNLGHCHKYVTILDVKLSYFNSAKFIPYLFCSV